MLPRDMGIMLIYTCFCLTNGSIETMITVYKSLYLTFPVASDTVGLMKLEKWTSLETRTQRPSSLISKTKTINILLPVFISRFDNYFSKVKIHIFTLVHRDIISTSLLVSGFQ